MGNLQKFHDHLNEFHTQFQQDRTYILIQRLRHNVIKTGLRAISTSYSRILLKDIASKLALDAPEDVEFIVAKVQLRIDKLTRILIFSLLMHAVCRQSVTV